MPLTGDVGHDIKEELKAGKPQAQAEAIALNVHRDKALDDMNMTTDSTPLSQGLDALVDRIRTVGDAVKRMDDEKYKGFTIYPAANSQFAAGKNGIIQKSKFATVEEAKKWIDSK